MSKTFNVTADCKPNLHYMVDLRSRLAEIKGYVDRGEYFTIHRARQYGKTTTPRALKEYLKDEYYVVSMDFQMQMSHAKFRDENTFSVAFAKAFVRIAENMDMLPGRPLARLKTAINENREELELVELFLHLSDICRDADRPLVLMIDEIDSAANNQVFLDFLSQLRGYYIDRDKTPTFRSVILAGVYDIKNLKRKFRPEDAHSMNSPWNIAVDFKVDMSFSAGEIAGMLEDYEREHATGMSVEEMAELIYQYTSGYPFLVSKFCKLIAEEVVGSEDFPEERNAWTYAGFLEA
ncbi:MAG TPA: 9-O-acetyl-N-acetylneuraminate esterase, partial [Lachnospiraceae bacterium]|nr:9-O-acetyl-N-acetylneuraminate esterase [Lachnospiraceae bacterium]